MMNDKQNNTIETLNLTEIFNQTQNKLMNKTEQNVKQKTKRKKQHNTEKHQTKSLKQTIIILKAKNG